MFHNIPIIPVAKGRHRTTKKGHNYTPRKTDTYETQLAFLVKRLFTKPLEGPLILRVNFYMPRPKYVDKKQYSCEAIPHDKKPDTSNLLKAFEDALNGIAWMDDSQIYKVEAVKYYAALGVEPFVSFEVEGEGE